MPFHVYGDNLLATFRNKPPQTKFSKLSFSPSQSQEEGRRLTNDVVKTFSVSHQHDKMLRDKLLNFDDHLVAACTNQQTGSLQLHDAHTGDLLQSFERAQNTILDCVQYRIGTTNYIAELDGRNVRFHEQKKM
ncbi:unnamed protein product [Oikopleura dioica]|uniref:Uncharacterized protein n=1 Tax=Oikopleura dioica TaxID=34765 RepID=E4Y1I4_OIKDI|nr:unnamed protein product [Oikopleura dioica]